MYSLNSIYSNIFHQIHKESTTASKNNNPLNDPPIYPKLITPSFTHILTLTTHYTPFNNRFSARSSNTPPTLLLFLSNQQSPTNNRSFSPFRQQNGTHTYKPILEIDALHFYHAHKSCEYTSKYTNEGKYWQPLYQTLWCNDGSMGYVLANERLSKVLDLFSPYPFSFNESYVSRVWIYTHDGQHVRHVCVENWIRRGSRGPASVISQSCQGLTLYNVICKELTIDDRRGDWRLWLYAPRTFLPSLGFFSCKVFLFNFFFFLYYMWNSLFLYIFLYFRRESLGKILE